MPAKPKSDVEERLAKDEADEEAADKAEKETLVKAKQG